MTSQPLTHISTRLMIRKLFFALMLSFHVADVYADDDNQTAIALAMGTLDKFILEFNNRDLEAVAATLNYPHVRFASGNVVIFEGAKSFADRLLYKTLTDSGWDHSHWLSRDVVLSSPDKVHIATTFQRYNESNEPIGTYESLYIVTQKNGHWGIQARSSLAP
jgi:hypothetical protein